MCIAKAGWEGRACSSSLWLAVRPFGNVRGDPFQNEFTDQIRYSIPGDLYAEVIETFSFDLLQNRPS
jgi:TolB-like protein